MEARRDDDDGRYWRDVIPSFGGDGRDVGSGSGCAIILENNGVLNADEVANKNVPAGV